MQVLNFSHPITSAQRAEIEQRCEQPITQLHEIPVQFDQSRPFEEQARTLLDAVGFTPEQWQTQLLVVNLPEHTVVAAVLLAELHGRMGHFPPIIRLQPDHSTAPPRYIVAEIINLPTVRGQAGQVRRPERPPAVIEKTGLPDPAETIPPDFSLACFEFFIEAFQDLRLPRFKGSALRGGFGQTFKQITCTYPTACGQRCRLGNDCAYGYVFETSLPEDSPVLKSISDIPRPFVIQTPGDKRTFIPAGDTLAFGVTLVGSGLSYLPHFVLTFNELGQQVGLGRGRGQYRLAAVDWVHPFQGTRDAVFRMHDELLRVPEARLTGAELVDYARLLPDREITLEFLTPVRLKKEEAPVQAGPPFDVLVRSLLSRISALSLFHCGRPLELDFRMMIDQARQVTIVDEATHWHDLSRYSNRQRRKILVGGLVGRVTYRGELTPYLPLLALGQLTHVGKGTVFGNGQYRINA